MDKKFSQKMCELSDLLAQSPIVCQLGRRYEEPSEDAEAGTIAHTLLDIEESMKVIYEKLLPRLRSGNLKPRQIEAWLQDIGDEFRHILYHIHDPLYFRDLFEDLPSPRKPARTKRRR